MNTLRARLTGALAFLALVAFVVGVPLALGALGAGLPTAWPSMPTPGGVWAALTSPDDGSLALGVVVVAAWGAWAFFTLAVVVEAVARLRGLRAPRLPGLGWPQASARTVVGAAALLFVAAPLAAQAAPVPLASVVVTAGAPAAGGALDGLPAADLPAADLPAAGAGTAPTPPPPSATAQNRAPAVGQREYTVRPGDSLWSIATGQLGSGSRYEQIVAANPQVLGGQVSLIQPGWVLRLPAGGQGAATPATVVVQRGDTLASLAGEYLGASGRYPEIAAASAPITQPGGVHLEDPDVIDVGWTLAIPAQAAAPPADAGQSPPPPPAPAPAPSPPPAQQAPSATSGAPMPSTADTPAPPGQGGQEGEGRDGADADAPGALPGDVPAPTATPAPPTASAAPGADPGEAAGASRAQRAPAGPERAGSDAPAQEAWPVRTVYGLGVVAASGLGALLLARRRAQQRRRAPGQVLPTTPPAAARAEAELAVVADALSVAAVDHALRALSAHCAASGTGLPRVRYARLDAATFTLHLAQPATLPAPWSGTADASTWTLHTDDATPGPQVGGASAPYPTLVTIGHDVDGAHLMLDLEYAGVLDLRGPSEQVGEVAAALAIELATSPWVEQAQITLVASMPELVDALDTGRLRYLPSPARLLDDLAERARDQRKALAGAHVDLAHARTDPDQAGRFAPEVVLIASELTEDQRERLHAIIDSEPALAIAAITANAGQGAWSVHLQPATGRDSEHHGVLAPLGIALAPQRLGAQAYAALVEAATLTHPDELTARTVPPTPAASSPTSASPAPLVAERSQSDDLAWAEVAALLDDQDLPTGQEPPATPAGATAVDGRDDVQPQTPDATGPAPSQHAPADDEGPGDVEVEQDPLGPQILVLGTVVVEGAEGPAEQSKRARMTELAAYIALHPGASSEEVDEAIWPVRRTDSNSSTRNSTTTKLRRWLGTAPDGGEHLPRHSQDGGYVLHPRVGTDLARWDHLLAGNPLTAPTQNLQRALELVRQRPFHAHHPRRYAWAESITQRLISEIVDVVYELARRQLLAGAWRAAETTLVKGLLVEPAQERLWRMRILAAYEARDEAAVTEATERLLVITERLECDLEPETTALLAQIKGPRADFDQLMATAQ